MVNFPGLLNENEDRSASISFGRESKDMWGLNCDFCRINPFFSSSA